MATTIYTHPGGYTVCKNCKKPVRQGQQIAIQFDKSDRRPIAKYHEHCWDVVSTQPPYFISPNA